MRFKFISTEDQNSGLLGWRLEHREDFDATTSPMTIAHDVMEHPVGMEHLDPCADELMALGAVLWGRGQGGYFWKFYHPNVDLSSDIARQFTDYHGHECLENPGRTTSLDEETEDLLSAMLQNARRELTEESELSSCQINLSIEFAKGWLRKGYRWARKRWTRAGQDSFTLTRMFEELESKMPKHTPDYGEEMYISMCMKRGTVDVKAFSYYEPGHSEYTPEEEEW